MVSAQKDKVKAKLQHELKSDIMKIHKCDAFLENTFTFTREVVFENPTDKIAT